MKTEVQWGMLMKHEVIERVARAWIGKKIKEYMGVEEQSVVNMIIKILNQRPNPQVMCEKLKDILDEKTGEFVMRLWQTLVFENMKIDEGLYDK